MVTYTANKTCLPLYIPVKLIPHNKGNHLSIFRKHSSGDLHSRLKTRKLLGVGETDDGDVHRSKVSTYHIKSIEVIVKGQKVKELSTA